MVSVTASLKTSVALVELAPVHVRRLVRSVWVRFLLTSLQVNEDMSMANDAMPHASVEPALIAAGVTVAVPFACKITTILRVITTGLTVSDTLTVTGAQALLPWILINEKLTVC